MDARRVRIKGHLLAASALLSPESPKSEIECIQLAYEKGLKLFENKQFNEAEKFFVEVIGLQDIHHPFAFNAAFKLAHLYHVGISAEGIPDFKPDLQKAVVYYKKLIDIYPKMTFIKPLNDLYRQSIKALFEIAQKQQNQIGQQAAYQLFTLGDHLKEILSQEELDELHKKFQEQKIAANKQAVEEPYLPYLNAMLYTNERLQANHQKRDFDILKSAMQIYWQVRVKEHDEVLRPNNETKSAREKITLPAVFTLLSHPQYFRSQQEFENFAIQASNYLKNDLNIYDYDLNHARFQEYNNYINDLVSRGLEKFLKGKPHELAMAKENIYKKLNDPERVALAIADQIKITGKAKPDQMAALKTMLAMDKKNDIDERSKILPVVMDYAQQGSGFFSSNRLKKYIKEDNFLAQIFLARHYIQTNSHRRQAILLYGKVLMLANDPARLEAVGLTKREILMFSREAESFLNKWANRPKVKLNDEVVDDKYFNDAIEQEYSDFAKWALITAQKKETVAMMRDRSTGHPLPSHMVAYLTLDHENFQNDYKGLNRHIIREHFKEGLSNASDMSSQDITQNRLFASAKKIFKSSPEGEKKDILQAPPAFNPEVVPINNPPAFAPGFENEDVKNIPPPRFDLRAKTPGMQIPSAPELEPFIPKIKDKKFEQGNSTIQAEEQVEGLPKKAKLNSHATVLASLDVNLQPGLIMHERKKSVVEEDQPQVEGSRQLSVAEDQPGKEHENVVPPEGKADEELMQQLANLPAPPEGQPNVEKNKPKQEPVQQKSQIILGKG